MIRPGLSKLINRVQAWVAGRPGGSPFFQNIATVTRANLIAVSLPVVAIPLMTRLFLPSDFGELALFTSLYGVLLSICTLRFDWSIPNSKNSVMATYLALVSTVIVILNALVISLLALVLTVSDVTDWVPVERLGILVYLLPIALIGGGLREALLGLHVRKGDLREVGRATIAQSVANISISVCSGIARLGSTGLVSALVLSLWIGMTFLLLQLKEGINRHLTRISCRYVCCAFRRYRKEALWSSLVSLLNALSANAPILILSAYYEPVYIGWYALMVRLLAAPIGVFGAALSSSFWTMAAQYKREGDVVGLARIYLRTTSQMALFCVPVAVACIAGPWLLGPLLGNDTWSGAGDLLIPMLPLFLGIVLFSSTNHLVVFGMQHLQLLCEITRLGLIVVSVIVADAAGWGFSTAVWMTSAASLVGYVVLFLTHLWVHKRHER